MTDAPQTPPPAALTLFAPCPRGVEPLLAGELTALGAASVKEGPGGVTATGTLELAYRACLWSRLASRVLLPLSHFALTDEAGTAATDLLYNAARAVPWTQHFGPAESFAVEVAGRSSALTHSHYAALKVKDAIADAFRASHGQRPNVDAERPDIRIHLHISPQFATLSLDLAGDSLHQRGYRRGSPAAPLKENLAAALLVRAGWPALAAQGAPLFDPMCGSGTLVIEAAWIAGDVAPGILREHWGFAAWRQHDAALWQRLHDEALQRRSAGAARIPPLFGRDRDAQAIAAARGNGQRAGLTGKVDFAVADATATEAPSPTPGLVITNPPYGERLGEEAELVTLYSLLGAKLKQGFAGWRLAVFTGRPDLGLRLGMKADKLYSFFNGPLPCKLLLIDIHAARTVIDAEGVETAAPVMQRAVAPDFANRLKKNLAHLGKWARRNDVSNYRLYDADLKDYAVAVDVYRTPDVHAVVQEYVAPKTIDPAAAERRLREALVVITQELQLSGSRLHYKQRAAQRGSSQYQRQSQVERYEVVEEHGAKLKVNFDDFLDTGLFLDHRPLRQRLKAEASGKRFLNLFCYTGAATVQAALGGAASTLSVDLSNTYLDWLLDNLELNGFEGVPHEHGPLPRAPHIALRADCTTWLATQAASPQPLQFDLIFCDPPTFSNSKKMEDSWDVQRDHAALINHAVALLAPGGVLYFSCNRQRFKLDPLEGLEVKDITAATLDEDFKRPPPAHRAWRISRPR